MIGGRGKNVGTPLSQRQVQQRREAAEARWRGHNPQQGQQQAAPQYNRTPLSELYEPVPGQGIDVDVPLNADDAIAARDARGVVRAMRERVLKILQKKQRALRRWYSRKQLGERYGVPESPWLTGKSTALERTVVTMSKTNKAITQKADQLDPATRRRVASLGGQAKARKYFRGGGAGSMPSDKSVYDVLRYERDELGNTETIESLLDESLLKHIPAKRTAWVTTTRKEAREYGEVEQIDFKRPVHLISDLSGGFIVAEQDDVDVAKRKYEYERTKQGGDKRFGTKPSLQKQLERAHEIGRKYTQR